MTEAYKIIDHTYDTVVVGALLAQIIVVPYLAAFDDPEPVLALNLGIDLIFLLEILALSIPLHLFLYA